ncbi:hypothetical protein HY792_05045, partial [Candidatus Desantisbacteria bacterium]|nr:hypothetical protein [Candidatus Desantisbacteria bacterium]
DKDTGMVISRLEQRRNVDYTVKYEEGRLLFKQPVPTIVRSNLLIDKDILDGHRIYVVANYEYQPESMEKDAGGIRLQQQIGKNLSVGATYVEEKRNTCNYQLQGTDIALNLSKQTRLTAEYAKTQAQDYNNQISWDGGLNFTPVTTDEDKQGAAWKAELSTEIGQWLKKRDFLWLDGYYKRLESGFSSSGNIQEQGTEKYGGNIKWNLTKHNTLLLKHDVQELLGIANPVSSTNIGGQKQSQDTMQLSHYYGKLHLTEEYKQIRLNSQNNSKITEKVAAQAEFKPNQNITTFIKHQQTIKQEADYQTTLGLEAKFTEYLSGRIQKTLGKHGQSDLMGLEALTNNGSKLYVNHSENSSNSKMTTLGANAKLTSNSEAYGQYELCSSIDGQSNQSLLGLNNLFEIAKGLKVNLNQEWSRTVKGKEDKYRQSRSMGIEYLDSDRLKTSAKLETISEKTEVERMQTLLAAAADVKLNQDFSLLTKSHWSKTENQTKQLIEAKFREMGLGIAYRPIKYNWVNLLAKYTFLSDQKPQTYEKEANIASLEEVVDVTKRLQLVEKFVQKVEKSYPVDKPKQSSKTRFWLRRLNYHITDKWDAAVEYRCLKQYEANDSRKGWLLEVNRQLIKYLRLGAGYNFTDFKDEEFSSNNYSSKGWFMRLQGKY